MEQSRSASASVSIAASHLPIELKRTCDLTGSQQG